MRRDYVLTFAAEAVTALAGVAVFRVGATYWDPDAFSAYVLSRRTLGFLYAQGLLGLSISLPRYVAIAGSRPDSGHEPKQYLLGAILIALASLSLLGLIVFAVPRQLAALFFGDSALAGLLPPVYVCTVGITLHILAYCYLRGRIRIVAANALQVASIAIVPVVVFLVPDLSPEGILLLTGAGWITVATIALVSIALRELAAGLSWNATLKHAWTLLRFGVPRLPGDLALTALLTLPANIAAHQSGLVAAGHVGFSIAVLGMVANFFAPIGLVLLPNASRLVATGRVRELRRMLIRVVAASAGLTAVGTVILIAATPWIVTFILGPEHLSAVPIVRTVALTCVPYVVYVVLRSPLDALTVQAINTRNLLIGLLTFALLVSVLSGPVGVDLAMLAAFSIVALLSIRAAISQMDAAERRAPEGAQVAASVDIASNISTAP